MGLGWDVLDGWDGNFSRLLLNEHCSVVLITRLIEKQNMELLSNQRGYQRVMRVMRHRVLTMRKKHQCRLFESHGPGSSLCPCYKQPGRAREVKRFSSGSQCTLAPKCT